MCSVARRERRGAWRTYMKVRSPVLGLFTSMCSRNRSLKAFWSHTLSSSASTRFHSCSTGFIKNTPACGVVGHDGRICWVWCSHFGGQGAWMLSCQPAHRPASVLAPRALLERHPVCDCMYVSERACKPHLCKLPCALPEEHDANVGGRGGVRPQLQPIVSCCISLQEELRAL